MDGNGRNDAENGGGNVGRELELKELGDGVVDVAAPLDGVHYGAEVVVGDDDVGGLLGHVRALDAHGEADVGALERRTVVGAVAGDGDHLPVGIQTALDNRVHQHVLVLRRGASEHAQTRPHPVHQLLLHLAVLVAYATIELAALQHNVVVVVVFVVFVVSPPRVVGANDATLDGNRARRDHIVTRHHTHHYSACLASFVVQLVSCIL